MACVTMLGLLAGGLATASPAAAAALIIRTGHIDAIGPELDSAPDGSRAIALRAHHDAFGWLEYDDFILHSDDHAKMTLPETYTDAADYSFIAEPGTTVWDSPYSQRPNLPWVGLSTESPTLRNLGANAELSVRLDAVTGPGGAPAPGDVAVWGGTSERDGRSIYFSTKRGLPDGFLSGIGSHVHYHWTFTEPGVYCFAFAVTATLPDGTRQEAREQLTHVVGSEIDPLTVEPCGVAGPYPEVEPKPTIPIDEPETVVAQNGGWSLAAGLTDDQLRVGLEDRGIWQDRHAVVHDPEDVIVRQLDRQAPGYVPNSREHSMELGWNAFGVDQADLADPNGNVTWRLDEVRGPGQLTVNRTSTNAAFRSRWGLTESPIWPGTGVQSPSWTFDRPGKYCLGFTWSVDTREHGEVSVSKTLTMVVDGAGFTPDEETYARTCADGGQPTPPEGGGGDPDPEEPWRVPNGSTTESGAVILNDGHIDVASLLEGQSLITRIKDDTDPAGAVLREPSETVLQLLPESETVVPSGAHYSFLGPEGSPIWMAEEIQRGGIVWPGWSTQEIPVDATVGGIRWTLDGAEGPGEVFLYQNDGFGGVSRILSSTQPGQPHTIEKNTHAHANWVFTAEGQYCLNFTRSATLTQGNAPVSDRFAVAFAVGEHDPRTIDPAQCAGNKPVADSAKSTLTSAAATTQRYGNPVQLRVSVSPAATGPVTAQVGGVSVSGQASAGTATLTVPARALRPGPYTALVSYLGGSAFEPSSTSTRLRILKAKPTVRAKVVKKVKRGKAARVRVVVKAPGVSPSGKLRVKVAGAKAKTVKVDGNGRAVVRLKVGKRVKLGKRAVKVVYRGDAFVGRGVLKKKLRVVR